MLLGGGILKYNRLYRASVRRVGPKFGRAMYLLTLLRQGSFEKNTAI